jgi:hypothetical protein
LVKEHYETSMFTHKFLAGLIGITAVAPGTVAIAALSTDCWAATHAYVMNGLWPGHDRLATSGARLYRRVWQL